MNQVTRFFPLMLSGVNAEVLGYFVTVEGALNAYDARCATINSILNSESDPLRGFQVPPVLLGVFSSLIDVPDLRDLDDFTKGFVKEYVVGHDETILIEDDLGKHIGPDTLVYLKYWCQKFQARDEWTSVKEATFIGDRLIWEPEMAGKYVMQVVWNSAVEYPNFPAVGVDEDYAFIEACRTGFLSVMLDLPEMYRCTKYVKDKVIFSAFDHDDERL